MIEVEWWEYDDAAEMAEAVAGDAQFLIESALDARGDAVVALPWDAESSAGPGTPPLGASPSAAARAASWWASRPRAATAPDSSRWRSPGAAR